MIRGTTPTHIFKLNMDTSLLRTVRITYKQGSYTILEKTESDCEMNGNEIKIKLSQEETLKFSHFYETMVQIKAMTTDSVVLASNVNKVSVDEILCEEVLS